jgi:hypothetical protein
MAVFISTPSQPNSMAIAASEAVPTPASTSTGTGGFIPTSQGGSTTPTYSTGTVTQSQMSTGLQGGAVFKPFSGKGALTLDNLLM